MVRLFKIWQPRVQAGCLLCRGSAKRHYTGWVPYPGLAHTIERVQSGVIHIRVECDGQQVASGSGFLHQGHLITNNHNLQLIRQQARQRAGLEVVLRSNVPGMKQTFREVRLTPEQFHACLVDGSEEERFDYAVLWVQELAAQGRYEFTFGSPERWRMGDEVALLGYPLNHQNLTCHTGIISSRYRKGNVQYLQLDASVNPSNSGGPLIDPQTGAVLGIVTRRHDGFTTLFGDIQAFFEWQRDRYQGDLLADLRPRQYEMDLERQAAGKIVTLLEQLRRSANVGIGYAFSIEHVAASHVFAVDPAEPRRH